MIYFINFLAVAAVPLAIGGYGAHLASEDTGLITAAQGAVGHPGPRDVGSVTFRGPTSAHLPFRSNHGESAGITAGKIGKGSVVAQRKIRQQSSPPEDVQQELGSILQYLRSPQPGMDSRYLADATAKMVENVMRR